MRDRWLRTALRSLDEEASFIAADDAVAASVVVERVLGAVAQLAEQAGLGRPGRVPGTRSWSCPGPDTSSRTAFAARPSKSCASSTPLAGCPIAGRTANDTSSDVLTQPLE